MSKLRQTAIPCTLMRGGTSKGPFFLATDLPADTALRDRVLLAVMGSPDPRQIDGVGGAEPLTSKVAIVSKSTRPDVDVDYLFAQVSIEKALVDVSPNCGNACSQPSGRSRSKKGWSPRAIPRRRLRSIW